MVVLKRLPYRPMLIIFAVFLLIYPLIFFREYRQMNMALSCFDDREQVELFGILYKKEYKNESYRLYIKNIYISNASFPGRAILITESDQFPLYSKIHMSGTVRLFSDAENDGGFDEKKYYVGQGIYLRLENCQCINMKASKISYFYENLYFLKERMKTYYIKSLYKEESALMSAMALGDKTKLDEDTKSLFSDAGLSHILAVSGLHISIVGMGLFRFLRKRGFGFIFSGILSLTAVFCYGVMTGLSVSTVRAMIMFFVFMVAQIFGEAYDMLSSWCLAVMIVLVFEPLSIYNSGFIFSFGAVLGIILVANPMVKQYEIACKKRFEKTLRFRKGMGYRKSLKEKVISAMLFSLGVQLFTLPIVALFYYKVPVYVLGLNLILIPLLGYLIGWGLIGGLLGVLFGFGSWILYPCHLFLYFYEMLSDSSLKLPVARLVTGHPSILKIIIYYVILMCVIWWRDIANLLTKSDVKKYVISKICLGIFCLFFLWLHPLQDFEMYMLSVGQGDGIFVRSKEGVTYMIDGGSTTKTGIGKYILEPFLLYHGASSVDYWLLSHLDTDHISGCVELLEEGYPIKYLVLTDSVKTEEDETTQEHFQTLKELCENNHTKILYVKASDTFGTKSLSFMCLSPDDPSTFLGPNENSMVLKMSYGLFDVIFTGDIGSEQEEAILKQWKDNSKKEILSGVEILKVAHHGSNNSNCSQWLETVSPKFCIISAGKNNSYGHPGRETIERLDSAGIPYLCTIDTGQIMVKWKNGNVIIERFRE